MNFEIDDAANEKAAQFWDGVMRAATAMSWQIIIMLGIIIVAAFAGQTSGSQSPAQVRYASTVIDIATMAWLFSLLGHAALLCLRQGRVHEMFTQPMRAWFIREAQRRPLIKLIPFALGHLALAAMLIMGMAYPVGMAGALIISVRRELPAINHALRCDAELMLKLQNKAYRVADPCKEAVQGRVANIDEATENERATRHGKIEK